MWWGSQLGLNANLKKMGPPHCMKPLWKWKVSWMWDRVKSPGSRRRTNSLTIRHAMKGNGIEGKTILNGKSPNNFKVRVSSPIFFYSTNKRKMYWANCKNGPNEVIWRLSTSLIPSTSFNEPHRLPINFNSLNEVHQSFWNTFSQLAPLHFLQDMVNATKHHRWYVWLHEIIQIS